MQLYVFIGNIFWYHLQIGRFDGIWSYEGQKNTPDALANQVGYRILWSRKNVIKAITAQHYQLYR